MLLEKDYQKELVKKIKKLIPNCFVLKNDGSNVPQGFPDLTIIFEDKYALLEVKAYANAQRQPNQEYRIEQFKQWTFSSFIYPENEEEVLNELQRAFGLIR